MIWKTTQNTELDIMNSTRDKAEELTQDSEDWRGCIVIAL